MLLFIVIVTTRDNLIILNLSLLFLQMNHLFRITIKIYNNLKNDMIFVHFSCLFCFYVNKTFYEKLYYVETYVINRWLSSFYNCVFKTAKKWGHIIDQEPQCGNLRWNTVVILAALQSGSSGNLAFNFQLDAVRLSELQVFV